MNKQVFDWAQKAFFAVLVCAAVPVDAREAASVAVSRHEDSEKVVAVVEAINHETRTVTLRRIGRDEVVTMRVSDEVRNLAQVNRGDQVIIEYFEAVAIDLKKGGGLEPAVTTAMATTRAKPGERPAGAGGEQVTIVATIVGIDPDEPSVLLRGPKGRVVDVVVRHPERLEGVDIGDQVVVTYTEAIAITVKPSPVAAVKPAAAPME